MTDPEGQLSITTASTMAALATAYKLIHEHDRAAQRAADRALGQLLEGTPYTFDGSELRVLSYSRSAEGMWHVTDGVACTCEAGAQPICRHRALYALLLAEAALRSPLVLRAQIIEQIAPLERGAVCGTDPLSDSTADGMEMPSVADAA